MCKAILCYGDSNTFGWATVERADSRYSYEERWPGILQGALGSRWRVIEEGLSGRTTVRDDPVEGQCRNGKTYLLPCLLSHLPLDVIVIMLGTNDLKARFNLSAWDVAEGLGTLIDVINSATVGANGTEPEILIIAPPPILRTLPMHAELFEGAFDKSAQLATRYAAIAKRYGVHFLDAGSVAKSSTADGFHLDPDAHRAVGQAVADRVKKICP
jgi:lysophospholipase L1-like esterase